MKSRTPTGTTPSARAKSASLNPMVTTRWGAAGIVVDPKACSIVTGKAAVPVDVGADVGSAGAVGAGAPPQAARRAASRAINRAGRRRGTGTGAPRSELG